MRSPTGLPATSPGSAEQLWHTRTHRQKHRHTHALSLWCPDVQLWQQCPQTHQWSRVAEVRWDDLQRELEGPTHWVGAAWGPTTTRMSQTSTMFKKKNKKKLGFAGQLYAAFARSRLLTCTVRTTMPAVFGDNAADLDCGKDDRYVGHALLSTCEA